MIKTMKCFESNDFCKREKNIRCENYQCGTFYCSIEAFGLGLVIFRILNGDFLSLTGF